MRSTVNENISSIIQLDGWTCGQSVDGRLRPSRPGFVLSIRGSEAFFVWSFSSNWSLMSTQDLSRSYTIICFGRSNSSRLVLLEKWNFRIFGMNLWCNSALDDLLHLIILTFFLCPHFIFGIIFFLEIIQIRVEVRRFCFIPRHAMSSCWKKFEYTF